MSEKSRRARLNKVLELRKEKLDACVVRLLAAKKQEADATALLETERARERAAIEARDKMTEGSNTVERWQEALDWLASREVERARAELTALRAKRTADAANQAVLTAKNDLRRIELLLEKFGKREQAREAIVERRASDEFAARKVLERDLRRDR